MPHDKLYKRLGISQTADKNSIKKAYRKMSKKTHPDTPEGNAKKFALVKAAFDILSDDERRAKYDATGDDSEKSPDNKHSDLINVIAYAFNQVISKCEQNGESPLEIDILYHIRTKIFESVTEANKNLRVVKGMLETDKKMLGRFSSDKENILEGIVKFRVVNLQISISNLEKNIENAEQALELIKPIKYRNDEKPHLSPGDLMMQRMSASGSFYA